MAKFIEHQTHALIYFVSTTLPSTDLISDTSSLLRVSCNVTDNLLGFNGKLSYHLLLYDKDTSL